MSASASDSPPNPPQQPATHDDSLSPVLRNLKAGNREAADEVTRRYFERIVRVAERRLAGRRLRATGAEDVALSAINSLWDRAAAGGFLENELAGKDDLWRLLCHLVRRKAEDHTRRERAVKRGGGDVRGESLFIAADGKRTPGLDGMGGGEFSPAELALFEDQHRQLMASLGGDDVLREVVTLRMEGHQVEEIALRFGKSDRWVKRKLALIRETWQRYLDRSAREAH